MSGQRERGEGSQRSHTFGGKARRAQIIECAIDAIAELGYAQASLAVIAKRAGISKGVISYHFKSKDELIEQIVVEVYTAGAQFMIPLLQATKTARETLRVYIESNIAFIGSHRKQMVALVEIFTNFRPEDGKPRFDAGSEEPILAPLEAVLRQGQQDGEFRDFSTRVMAITIRRAIDAVPPQLIATPTLDPLAYGRELSTLFDLATRQDS